MKKLFLLFLQSEIRKIFFTFFILFFLTFFLPKPFKELKVIFNCSLEANNISLKNDKNNSIQKFITWLIDIQKNMKNSGNELLVFFVGQITIEDLKKNKNIDTSLIDAIIAKSSEEEKALQFFDDNFIQTEKEIDDLEDEIFSQEKSSNHSQPYYLKKMGLNIYIGKDLPKKNKDIELFFIIQEENLKDYSLIDKKQNLFVIDLKKKSNLFDLKESTYYVGCPQKKNGYGVLTLIFQGKNITGQTYETVLLNEKESNRSYILHNY